MPSQCPQLASIWAGWCSGSP